jgi:hypothetical protein
MVGLQKWSSGGSTKNATLAVCITITTTTDVPHSAGTQQEGCLEHYE